MSLADQLQDYVNAAFTGLWVQTSEADEAEREILRHAREHDWRVAVWNVAQGLRMPGATDAGAVDGGDPLAALRSVSSAANPNGTSLLLLHNFHRFLNSPEIVQTMFAQLLAGKNRRTFIVVLSPVVQIPIELEKLFVVLEHALPNREQLLAIVQELTSENPDDLPGGDELNRVLDSAAGLTRYEAEGAFALSLARHNAIRPEAITEVKAQTLRKNNVLTLHRGQERFATLGGLANVKDFCRRALSPGKPVRARGVLLLGVPGTGKSAFAKALGNETGRPTLTLDIGALMGSLVGQTEQNIRQALRIADAMAPCVLFTDELEKALSGVGGNGDSGVSTRLFGTLLTWLAEHESDVFFVGTANDISRLPPEFTRAERLDAVFFLDFPGVQEKLAIWAFYCEQFGLDPRQPRPVDADFTGAEIRACCRLAALLGVPLTEAAQNVVPVAKTASEAVDRLRSWADGRCLAADRPGFYRRDGGSAGKSPRNVKRDPSNN
jgi:hypothetical protein